MRDVSHRIAQITPCGLPERERRSDEQWRPEGGGAVQVDGRSAPRQVGGEKRVKKESEVSPKGERWRRNMS